ncbi:hypothetical protein BpHYR1_043825 [Brachionus plicatilis]|uniref:Uncharacterized protein n=1 Tax=Brachionus plicatilis TaxID=10195 RepID=A0A3M7RWP8_BRAPC|nr:hypothetical protein BpHYR1_043825 [Brachionus plicatilis]
MHIQNQNYTAVFADLDLISKCGRKPDNLKRNPINFSSVRLKSNKTPTEVKARYDFDEKTSDSSELGAGVDNWGIALPSGYLTLNFLTTSGSKSLTPSN